MEDFMQLFFRSDVSYQTQYQNTDNPYSMNNYTPPKKKERKKKVVYHSLVLKVWIFEHPKKQDCN